MKNNSKVFLFLGGHGGGTEDDPGIKDAESAILKIKETTNNIPNKNKILVVECGGWERSSEVGFLTLSGDKVKGKIIFNRVVNHYQNLLKKFERGEDADHYDWASLLLKFGIDNGYITTLEKPNFEISWDYFIEFGDEERFQLKRDEIFFNQLKDLMENDPSKTLVIVRGKKHKKWLQEILNKNNIAHKIIEYS